MYAKNRDKSSEYVWTATQGKVIDSKNAPCLTKYANNYVSGLYYCNAKVKNYRGKSKMYATREISPGEEIYWNYGSSFFQAHGIKKITKKMIEKKLVGEVLLRDCDKGLIGNKQ